MELVLANIPLDLQITICIFLHPSDILALRKTCKVLELVTRKRIVWVAALHRVCLDNTLFLPSFPIPDMTDLELERAAMAPRRWIELCSAFTKQHSNEFSKMLHPRTTRIIKDSHADSSLVIMVPGGRYLVTAGTDLLVWDLGYVSTVDCKLVASAGLEDGLDFEFCVVQATSDGKGLIILSSYDSNHLSIFEIYPQSEMPLLNQIAYLDWLSTDESPAHLLPDILICHVFLEDRIAFRVVDYRTNYSTCFSADVGETNIHLQTFATKTAIIVYSKEGILIWAIPPLSPPQPSDLHHFLDNNSTHTPPLLKIPFPDGIVRHVPIFAWMAVSSWYFTSWDSVYFDILFTDSILQRFKVIIQPDLSDASLHVINMTETISDDVMESLNWYEICGGYRVCEDALVYLWNNPDYKTWGAYTGLTSAPLTNVVTRWNGHIDSLCPTSGRFVYRTDDGSFIKSQMVVVDLF